MAGEVRFSNLGGRSSQGIVIQAQNVEPNQLAQFGGKGPLN